MNNKVLESIRNDVANELKILDEHNKRVRKIKALESNGLVKEYLKLTGISPSDLEEIEIDIDEICFTKFRKYMSEIKEDETYQIYVYIGTYEFGDKDDLFDERVSYDATTANYRIYRNIEQLHNVIVDISLCEEFEKTHTVIKPQSLFKDQAYFDIQKEFISDALTYNEYNAVERVLKKHSDEIIRR